MIKQTFVAISFNFAISFNLGKAYFLGFKDNVWGRFCAMSIMSTDTTQHISQVNNVYRPVGQLPGKFARWCRSPQQDRHPTFSLILAQIHTCLIAVQQILLCIFFVHMYITDNYLVSLSKVAVKNEPLNVIFSIM